MTDPNENTQAEIYANIRDKALLEGALKELQACSDDLHSHGHALAAARVEKRIRALKRNPLPAVVIQLRSKDGN